MPGSETLARGQWSYLLLTPTRHKSLTCDFATPWRSPVLRVPQTNATRSWSLRDRLTERDITELITAYRDGATAASFVAD
jgi:hypothetical protein